MSVSLNATNVRREKKTGKTTTKKKWQCGVQQNSCSLDLKCRSCWSGPTLPRSPLSHIKRKEKPHLKMLRLWCELCVIVCSCFLDDSAERGPYLNTRKNKDSLQSNKMVSSIVDPMLRKISATTCWLRRWNSQASWEFDVERTDGAKEKSESWHSFQHFMSHGLRLYTTCWLQATVMWITLQKQRITCSLKYFVTVGETNWRFTAAGKIDVNHDLFLWIL